MKDLLFGNLKTRLLALVLAVFTWVSVWRETTDTFTAAPVVEILRPANVVVLGIEDEAGNPRSAIEVKLSGPRGQRTDLRSLRVTKSIEAEAGGKVPSEVTFEVTEDVLLLPPKFRLVEAKPRRLRVRLDTVGRQQMRLVPARAAVPGQDPGLGFVEGKPAEGFYLKSAWASPNWVEVTGPKQVVEKRQAVPLTPVRVDGLSAGVHQFSATIVPDLDGQAVRTGATIVVTVEIAEEPEEAEFRARVTLIQTEEFAKEFLAEVAEKEVVVRARGPRSALAELKARPELVLVPVDIAAMRPEECQPVDDKELIATRPLAPSLRARFAGSDLVELSVKTPEKAETLVTFRRRPK